MSQKSASEERLTYKPYVVGFVLSVTCTLAAYFLVVRHALGVRTLVYVIAALALTQFLVQITLFLHLGQESKPRFKLLVFGFMVTVVIILVFGSIWIMSNLNYRMMTPQNIQHYLQAQNDGF